MFASNWPTWDRQGSISGIPYGPLNLPWAISEWRARSSPWSLLGVAPKQTISLGKGMALKLHQSCFTAVAQLSNFRYHMAISFPWFCVISYLCPIHKSLYFHLTLSPGNSGASAPPFCSLGVNLSVSLGKFYFDIKKIFRCYFSPTK